MAQFWHRRRRSFSVILGTSVVRTSTGGAARADAQIQQDVRRQLSEIGEFRASLIRVTVERGVVTLAGATASAEQRIEAQAKARNVRGVSAVKSELQVARTSRGSVAPPPA